MGWVAWGAWLCALALTTGAAAQGDDADPRIAEARVAFVEAREHFDDERFRLAAESFQRAYDLLVEAGSPMAPTILYNLGTALDELPGHQQEARDAYARFLADAPPAETDEDRAVRHTVEERIRELDLSLAEQRGAEPSSEPAEPTEPPAGDAPEREDGVSLVGPLVMAGGGALLVTGAIVGAIALGQGNDIEEACPELTGCDPSLEPDYDGMRARSVAADVLIFGGLAVVAVGAVLTFTLKSSGTEDVNVGAACDGQGCYASARGTF